MSGAERSLLELVQRLDRQRFEPLAILPGEGPLATALRRADVSVTFRPLCRFKRTRQPGALARYGANWFRQTASLALHLRQQRIDLLHANSTNAALYGVPAARLAGRPSVWHLRDLRPLRPHAPLLGRLATRVVAISHAVADHAAASGVPGDKIVTIWNGIDSQVFHPRIVGTRVREELGLPAEAFVAVMVAQMVPWKGHRYFLEAARRVLAEAPAAYFLIVGEDLFHDHPDYGPELHALAQRLGLGGRLIFTGYRSDVAEVLAAADVLVMPSLGEPFGRTLLEAMSLAKPVIATAWGGPLEIVANGRTGFLVPPANAGALAKALVALARDPARARSFGQQGRLRVERYFTAVEHCRRIEELYDEIWSTAKREGREGRGQRG